MVCPVCGGEVSRDGVTHCKKISSEVVKESGRKPGYGVMTCEEKEWTKEQHRWYQEFMSKLVFE